MPHLRYLWYVLKHKWFVFVWCCRLGIPWQGITHDLSKFSAGEWFPYVDHLYRDNRGKALDAASKFGCFELIPFGYLAEDRFQVAVHRHYNANPHHPEYWQMRDKGGAYEMPHCYRLEMLADWLAMSGSYEGVRNWYQDKGHKKLLHPVTCAWVEEQLGIAASE